MAGHRCGRCGCTHAGGCLSCGCTCPPINRGLTCPCCLATDKEATR